MTVKQHGMKARIARELGISGQAVSKLIKLGMPTSSADAARRWRRDNLHPGRVRPDPGPSPETLLQRAAEACQLGEAARVANQLEVVADHVRAALRAVPKPHRPQLLFPFALFIALIGPRQMSAMSPQPRRGAPAEPDDVAAEMHVPNSGTPESAVEADQESLDPGEVAYALACGEAYIR
ncbi:MAG TPA: hypothetical protein PKB14_07770 [Rubrivivax sp.]|nr:hypothetical protein [Rubrivivax sp.]